MRHTTNHLYNQPHSIHHGPHSWIPYKANFIIYCLRSFSHSPDTYDAPNMFSFYLFFLVGDSVSSYSVSGKNMATLTYGSSNEMVLCISNEICYDIGHLTNILFTIFNRPITTHYIITTSSNSWTRLCNRYSNDPTITICLLLINNQYVTILSRSLSTTYSQTVNSILIIQSPPVLLHHYYYYVGGKEHSLTTHTVTTSPNWRKKVSHSILIHYLTSGSTRLQISFLNMLSSEEE